MKSSFLIWTCIKEKKMIKNTSYIAEL